MNKKLSKSYYYHTKTPEQIFETKLQGKLLKLTFKKTVSYYSSLTNYYNILIGRLTSDSYNSFKDKYIIPLTCYPTDNRKISYLFTFLSRNSIKTVTLYKEQFSELNLYLVTI